MDYFAKGGNIHLRQNDFDLAQTLDCGQSFRWEPLDADSWRGYYLSHYLEISQAGNEFVFHNVSESEFLDIWADYFDLYTDYGEIKKRLSEDSTLSEAVEKGYGIRILRQDVWEMLISFIISQNNNIPRIKSIIARLCEEYGGFPTKEMLMGKTADDFAFLRAGFRAKYIADAVEKVTTGQIGLEELKTASDDDVRKALLSIKGVGPKVCACVMLFGLYRIDECPVDVWMKRVFEKYYPDGLPKCCDGIRGIAQQYLFYGQIRG